ncbi:MAG: patatin-like phospholipase family protein [Chloroflexi bacterium AL-W]|nr:patatin-like phospholipase family protein [Chloroflexi bacterium AL-N1]NOK66163.1 patatin-like phospholipase family protein [Chloroflexi bacterium AL-N10]NOK73044.1 patatin-like phospholipase family protein [Chloroflexi bacterium AL-N5]NOK79941.1 patatin-like phospholipase family protein [Chloroflexi bacterium AL-W]NOK88203.1 patatin-like phospholipase family protein [Chloroflexi bacterium AL-N15]
MQTFVLSSGGNRGGIQAGSLLALVERGILPQFIVGPSVGAINSVALAADPTRTGIERVVRSWHHVRRADVFPGNPFTVGWRILTGQGSLHDQRNFQHFIRAMTPTGIKYFSDLHIPCIVTATR